MYFAVNWLKKLSLLLWFGDELRRILWSIGALANGASTSLSCKDFKCKYFDKEYFKIESFNLYYKKSYEKRPNFKLFIDYVHTLEIPKRESITYTVEEYIKIFNKEVEKNIIDQKILLIKLHQEKFNGKLFLQYTEAKNINKYKEDFRNHISQSHDFNEWLTINNLEFINDQIKEYIFNIYYKWIYWKHYGFN